jgi:hypothetical protein
MWNPEDRGRRFFQNVVVASQATRCHTAEDHSLEVLKSQTCLLLEHSFVHSELHRPALLTLYFLTVCA